MTNIDREHPDYAARRVMHRTYKNLYAGGELLKANAAEYLVRRQKEPSEVYAERLNAVFYENYIGSIIDWYAATLFRREPVLSFEGNNEAGRRFFSAFTEDCDRKGTALSDFYRRQLVEALVSGTSYILVDFPRVGAPAGSRAEEEASGRSRAYLVEYTPQDLINWSYDETGAFEWVVLRTCMRRQESPEAASAVEETRWLYFDREEYRVYRRANVFTGGGEILLTDWGRHGLAKLGRVPLFEVRLSDGLWLMNKAGLLQLEHFNKSNALAWALSVGLFSMPVIYSDKEWDQIAGESYYIQLGPQDRFGWTEPEGHVYQIAAENLSRLQEEIYRVCYLMQQSGGDGRAARQSGLSKQRDFAVTQEVLRAYGDAVKDSIKRVLRAIEAAREDNLVIDVSGLDEFDIGDFSSELDDAERLLRLGPKSATLRKQVFRKLAFKYLCDVRQAVKDRIGQEIDEWLEAGEK